VPGDDHTHQPKDAAAAALRKTLVVDEIPPRAEHKFLLTPWQVEAARNTVGMHCQLDSYAAREPNHRYTITSLYFDTAEHSFYHAKELGAHRRYKLRVRRYGLPAHGPVFFEVKHRVGDVIRKARSIIDAEQWVSRLSVDGPAATSEEEHDFRARIAARRAEPTMLVRYEREAWKGDIERYVRVTFDTHLQWWPCSSYDLDADAAFESGDAPTCFDESSSLALLEVKFERDIPRWLTHLIRSLGLQRVGYSKYGTGMKRAFGGVDALDSSRRLAPAW
jgi:SPX domain protein involved in polyphosphate accumulation